MNGIKTGLGITPGEHITVPTLRSAEISGSVSAFPVMPVDSADRCSGGVV